MTRQSQPTTRPREGSKRRAGQATASAKPKREGALSEAELALSEAELEKITGGKEVKGASSGSEWDRH